MVDYLMYNILLPNVVDKSIIRELNLNGASPMKLHQYYWLVSKKILNNDKLVTANYKLFIFAPL
jgi:hypothetical protein